MPTEKPVREEKEYSVVEEASEIVVKLQQRYPKVLWAVIPEQVVVLGVTNKERPKTMRKLAKITRITPAYKALIRQLRGKVKYFIEVYFSDWHAWSNARRQWVIFHELVHIPGPDESGLVKHDVEDFELVLDAVGLSWFERESLPDLLDGELFPFKESLSVRLHLKPENEQDGSAPEENPDEV